jgi:hypothetical protein
MMVFGPLGFAAPWLLWALAALPVLWFLLRAVPPAPIRRRFPGVALLLGLTDDEHETDKTPWWLLLLRMLAVAAVILGFAGPVLNPEVRQPGSGPLLILTDGGWPDARDWPRRQDRLARAVADAERDGRQVALLSLADPSATPPVFTTADALAERISGLVPAAWEPEASPLPDPTALLPEGRFDTLWLSDGLARDSRTGLLAALEARGTVTVSESGRDVLALAPAEFRDGAVVLPVLRAQDGAASEAEVVARGLDPSGIERELARVTVPLAAGQDRGEARFDLPPELRNRLTRFDILGQRSAGTVSLADDALRRRKVALVSGGADREGLELLSPTHYLEQALAPNADLIEGTLSDVLLARPDAIILADVAKIAESADLLDWVDKGGLLIRFAGPRLATSDVGRAVEDPLLPVRLREGGRSVGGSMSWGEPRRLAPFAEGTPFAGLAVPDEVTVREQVMAQPDPELSSRTIAALTDGTPLVTARAVGEGRVILFHVTANAEWSTLPLSGLFVQMLERLAVASRAERPKLEDLAGTTWTADRVLDGFGELRDAGGLAGIPGERLADARIGPALPPGLYSDGDRRLAMNAIAADRRLAPAAWPSGVTVEGLVIQRETLLKGWFLAAALILLAADAVASLWLGGRLARRSRGAVATVALALLLPLAPPVRADDAAAINAANNVVLAHVLTGDAETDRVAEAGMKGLSEVLFARTTVEPVAPVGIDLERDDLSLYPFLYWPVTASQPAPTPQAYAKLNRFLRSGGMILFDTRDADRAGTGASTPASQRLQALAAPLDIPPLEPIPRDHVLTRAFYLLSEFPGRYAGPTIWVEAAPPDAEQAEGMPFRNLNDGVTPVVIGANDWASAWATDARGLPMFPVGRGMAGERQREIAYRFGVNLIMHVLTGNYKSDQVHVPALLERLGQ